MSYQALTILTNMMHNQRLFWNFDTLKTIVVTCNTFSDKKTIYPIMMTIMLQEYEDNKVVY